MSNTFSLDDLRVEVEREYQPMVVTLSDGTEVSLRNLLRLDEKARRAVMKSIRALEDINEAKSDNSDDDADDLIGTASEILALAADSNGQLLIKELAGDIALTMRVLEKWMQNTSVGKAPSSEN